MPLAVGACVVGHVLLLRVGGWQIVVRHVELSLVVRCCLVGWHWRIVGLSQIGDAFRAWVVLYDWGDDGSGGRK